MYATPIQAFCYILRFYVTFIWVKWTPVDKLTQNLILTFLSTSTFKIMNNSEQGVHLLEGRTCTHPQYRHFATYYGFRVTFIGVQWTPVNKLTKLLVLAFLSNSTFMIMNDSEQGVHLLEGRTCTHPQNKHFPTYYGFWLPFWGSNGHQLTN